MKRSMPDWKRKELTEEYAALRRLYPEVYENERAFRQMFSRWPGLR